MARSGIQYSDVQHAIDTLLARGDTPSVQRIREVLGTGSFTTISEHFRLWRTEREQNRDVPPPKGVPEVVVNVASELWREAQDAANQALVHYREDANRQVESAQQAAAEARQQAANAEQRESALAAHFRQTEERLETLNRELAESQANERHWHQQAENLRQEAAQHHHQLDQTQQALKEAQTHYSEKLEEQQKSWEQRLAQEEQRNEASEGKLMALLDTLRQERAQEEKALQKRLQQWEQRAEALSHELKQKNDALQGYQQECSLLKQRITELERQNGELHTHRSTLEESLEKAHKALETQQQQTRDSEHWQEQLWQRMASLQAQLADLPSTLASSSDDTPETKKPSR
nr:DNA-binding protein [uncultured Halomonas sp.]